MAASPLRIDSTRGMLKGEPLQRVDILKNQLAIELTIQHHITIMLTFENFYPLP